MEKDRLTRKRAAILRADVVDSARLVRRDETPAHECLPNTLSGFSKVKRTPGLPSLFLLASFMCFNVAQAEGRDSYIGIGVGTADTSVDGLSSDADLEVFSFQLGAWMTDNISIELRMGVGTDDDSVGAADLEIESIGGLYGIYHWNLGSQLSVYGIAGGSRAFVKVSGNGGSVQEDDNGLSYGAGIKFSMFRIEYMSYLNTSEIEADVASVGLLYTFD